MIVRNAEKKDIERIGVLLGQVNNVHAKGRPDIFKFDLRKYTNAQLQDLLNKDDVFIYIAADDDDVCLGYAFCFFEVIEDGTNLMPRKSVYIDDLCVDEKCRGMGVGTLLYNHVICEAEKMGCHNVTLNVWSFNESAMKFYEKCGMSPLKVVMEKKLK